VIEYRTGNNLELAAVIQLYKASTLGERRPIDDPGRFAAVRGEDLVSRSKAKPFFWRSHP
jgi:hypothetical protein